MRALAVAGGLAAAAAACARPFRVAVAGESMVPALLPGEWAVATRSRRHRVGDVVVVEHPLRPGYEMVKRLRAGPGDRPPGGPALGPGEWWVEGDASEGSTDSRHFGPIPAASIRGVVRLVYRPWGRRRLLRRGDRGR